MKKQVLVAVILLAGMTSCGFLGGATSSTTATPTTTTTPTNAAATQAGKNAGVAIDALAAQYKIDGKIDMKNFSNLANILNLIGSAQGLKENKADDTYKKGFVQGLVANSINIDNVNADAITGKLQTLAENTDTSKLQDAVKKGQATAEEVQNVANSITSIISLFKK